MNLQTSLLFIPFLLITVYSKDSIEWGPPREGFGSRGKWEISRDTLFSGVKPAQKPVYFYTPKEKAGPYPTVFFCHGIGAEDPDNYIELIEHIVSRGCALIYPTYASTSAMINPPTAYRSLRRGFRLAVKEKRDLIDSSKIAITGHSYGGGAVPSTAWRWIKERKWGSAGAFLYIMAPWYSYNISEEQLGSFPEHIKCIVEVFEDDHVNDHRMGADIFNHLSLPDKNKNFIILHSDRFRGSVLSADHGVPSGLKAGATINALDYYGIYRIFDALKSCSFESDSAGCAIALGGGTPAQCFMGRWPGSRPVKPLMAGFRPVILFPQSNYLNFWKHKFNPRSDYDPVLKTLPRFMQERRMTVRNYMRMKPGHYSEKEQKIGPDSSLAQKCTGGFCGKNLPPSAMPGTRRVIETSFPHPSFGDGRVYIFKPDSSGSKSPVIFFLHGFQWPIPDYYSGYINHLVSHGYIVVFPSYAYFRPTINNRRRYNLLYYGVEEALSLLRNTCDSSRTGFIGHSYGGGAVPAIAYHVLKEKNWGRNGSFLHVIAPWYIHHIKPEEMAEFSSDIKMVVQVFEEERFNDWRIAEDLFYSIPVPLNNKDFIIVHSDSTLRANHTCPLWQGSEKGDQLDRMGIARISVSLASFAFTGDSASGRIALGNGREEQVSMGYWTNGRPVTRLTVTDNPVTPEHFENFLFKWRRPWNPRRRHYKPKERARYFGKDSEIKIKESNR